MRGFRTGALAIALALGSVANVVADDDSDNNDAKPSRNPLGFRWSPGFAHAAGLDQQQQQSAAKKPPAKKPAAKKDGQSAKPAVVDSAASLRAKEEAALLRRLAVCDKLKEIAIRTNDNELLARVETLDERARTTYSMHTAQINAHANRANLDEQILDDHLGTTMVTRQGQEENVVVTAQGDDRSAHATAREDKR